MGAVRAGTTAVATASLLAGTALLLPGHAVAEPADLDWGPCPEGSYVETAQCAEVEVPRDYANPDGPTIELTVSKLPAQGPKRGVLFGNPGGPGGSALPMFEDNQLFSWPQELRNEWDLIGVQPRGLPFATALECTPPLDITTATINYGGATRAMCDAQDPGYTATITTETTARDWEEVRRKLGDERISIFGLSYGTFLGSTYATLFPQHVDRLVLDSAMDPDWAWNEVLWQQNDGYKQRVYAMMQWIADNDETYGLGDTPLKVYQRWSEVVATEAGASPTLVPPAAQIGDVPPALTDFAEQYIAGINLTEGARTQFEGWLSNIITPSQMMSTVYGLTREAAPQRDMWPLVAQSIRNGGTDPAAFEMDDVIINELLQFQAMQNVIMCNENQVAARPWDYPAFLAHSFLSGDMFELIGYTFSSGAACAGAPPVTVPVDVTNKGLAVQPLQLQSRQDPQTPYTGGLSMSERMGSHLISVDGGDHGAFAKGNGVVDAAVVEYLRTGATDVVTAPEAPIRAPLL
ncbi:alpha/beta hydrolase [Hoyosella altamirensis]|uniref:Pimeloyl-ACP methyl ester carboxylesterase n=1 Tax=Hoyosella altamirensis TaxID=616997 RepID=A0A839RIJ7_9ACTN|nr:alpha/beta hydrolase [Hoyosella altamirensis]MBB3036485.1 pimeloyl-ACP methyl ester carboxylesterase [Hoyosella altamirensis]